jgi:hypothetical protein
MGVGMFRLRTRKKRGVPCKSLEEKNAQKELDSLKVLGRGCNTGKGHFMLTRVTARKHFALDNKTSPNTAEDSEGVSQCPQWEDSQSLASAQSVCMHVCVHECTQALCTYVHKRVYT